MSNLPRTNPGAGNARLLMLCSVAFFIGNTMIIRLLGTMYSVDSWLVSAFRFVVGFGLVLVPLVPGRPLSLSALVRNPWVIARGVIGGISIVIYYETIVLLGAGRATFLNNTYIIIAAILAAVFLREKLRPLVLGAIFTGTIGIALLTGMTLQSWSIRAADLLALLGALMAGTVVVIIRKLHQRESTRTIFAGQCAWGMLFAVVPATNTWETPTAVAAGLLVTCAVFAGFGQLAMTAAYRLVPVAEGALLQMLTPVGIGIGGALFFNETYTLFEATGAVLIVLSCILASTTRQKPVPGSGHKDPVEPNLP